MKKILIIGIGFLGDYILQELKNHPYRIFTTFHNNNIPSGIPMDISNKKMVEDVFDDISPEIVINCAANTNVDYLEENPKQAFDVNSVGAKNVAISCNKHNSRLIHISTDGIFDGKNGMYNEEDIPKPVNIYGKSKLKGEKFVKEYSSNYAIIRTNFFGFDLRQHFLFNWIFNSLKNKQKIIGFDDVVFNPFEISNLAQMIQEMTLNNYQGVIHLSSDLPYTKYQFALKIAEEFHFDENLITKDSIMNTHLKAIRPLNTTLDNTRSKSLLKLTPNSIENSLKIIRRKYYKDIL